MAYVKFTPNLKRFFPDLKEIEIEADTVAEVIAAVEARWTGLADYLVDEHGVMRQHVNIFVGEEMLEDRQTLSDPVSAKTRIYIMQALSGG
jgi:molybdopterin synthase sulfur carrier subunit